MKVSKIFKMPKPVNITGRTSTITNSFVTSIIPSLYPTEEQIKECLEILKIDPDDLRCAYCGDKSTEWDHLRPIVDKKRPTGYISNIYNLVPSCGKCNQSKGNKYWKDWIVSNAKLSPKKRGTPELKQKIAQLEKYERWGKVVPLNFQSIVDAKSWARHWENCRKVHGMMKEAQKLAKEIKEIIAVYQEKNK